MVTVLAGGVGAARFLKGLVDVVPADEITAIVNVGDDLELHGLHISPDLDTVTYTLAGAINTETGWGLTGESWQAMASLERYGGLSWEDHVKIDEKFYRPAEVDLLIGDSSKTRSTLGWKPKVSFPELVHRMVDADIALLEHEGRPAN